MKNLVIVSFPAKPETLETLKESMRRALPDTRNFEGCLSVNTFIEESTNTIHLIAVSYTHLTLPTKRIV